MSHSFFADIDFDLLLKKEIKAPLIPDIVSPKDLSHFDENLTGEPCRESVVPEEAEKIIHDKKDLFSKFNKTHESDSLKL